MKLEVGQIVYVILEKQTSVLPMQVVEEITKKMLQSQPDGKTEVVSETDYLLKSGSNAKYQLLSEIQGEIFDSSEYARTVMIERATNSINRHIENAVLRANERFGIAQAKNEVKESIIPDDIAYVDLGNGLKGKVRI